MLLEVIRMRSLLPTRLCPIGFTFGLSEETPEDSCLGYQLFGALKAKYFQMMKLAEELQLRMK